MDGGGGTPRPALLTGAKKSHLGCLISFELDIKQRRKVNGLPTRCRGIAVLQGVRGSITGGARQYYRGARHYDEIARGKNFALNCLVVYDFLN